MEEVSSQIILNVMINRILKVVFVLDLIWMVAFIIIVVTDYSSDPDLLKGATVCTRELFLLERIGAIILSTFFCIFGYQITKKVRNEARITAYDQKIYKS